MPKSTKATEAPEVPVSAEPKGRSSNVNEVRLKQIRADEGVVSARVRKNAQREADANPQKGTTIRRGDRGAHASNGRDKVTGKPKFGG